MKNYTTLLVDLDGTVFDFLKSEKVAIKAALKMNGIPFEDATARRYSEINTVYWSKYERGEIKREEIFENRFITLLDEIGITADTKKLSDDYFVELSKGHDLKENAKEVLEKLKEKGYFLVAATNGVSKTQYRRLRDADIEKYFDVVCVSEDAGCQKPQKEYFDYVISKCPEKDRSKMLIIGDRESSDVLGGINAKIDVCWLNEVGEAGHYNIKYEIKELLDLLDIL